MYLCLGIQSALDSTILAVKKNCSVESGDTSTRLGVLLKICLFVGDNEVFWILIEKLANVGILVTIYLFSRDIELFLCLLPRKFMAPSFFP